MLFRVGKPRLPGASFGISPAQADTNQLTTLTISGMLAGDILQIFSINDKVQALVSAAAPNVSFTFTDIVAVQS